jgi:hypothetical protein
VFKRGQDMASLHFLVSAVELERYSFETMKADIASYRSSTRWSKYPRYRKEFTKKLSKGAVM